ncbi:MAG: FAD-binding oxidoreductase, partial [Inquilinus limosus]|nr:FAD-binding oxidoreductase [Inquilinus limosus]
MAVPQSHRTTLDPRALTALRTLLGDRVSTAAAVLEQHGREETWHPTMPPDAVAFPHSTEEVAAVLRICAEHEIPVVPYGTGTSLEGG